MGFNTVPKGRIVPMYLTDEGNVHSIFLHDMEELELIQTMVASILGGKIVVDTNNIINNPDEKISILESRKN